MESNAPAWLIDTQENSASFPEANLDKIFNWVSSYNIHQYPFTCSPLKVSAHSLRNIVPLILFFFNASLISACYRRKWPRRMPCYLQTLWQVAENHLQHIIYLKVPIGIGHKAVRKQE